MSEVFNYTAKIYINMNKEAFLQRLTEDKFFSNPDEQIEYRLPVVQWYIDNYNSYITHYYKTIWPQGIKIDAKNSDPRLINYAFNALKNRIGEFQK